MIDVCFNYNESRNLYDKLAVVIDTLRATTTIITAIYHGAECIIPVESIEEAFIQKELYTDPLLGGEREGLKIEGFDLGNSPLEYSEKLVSGKTIIMTTTNGTRAIKSAIGSNKIILAALINSGLVADYMKLLKRDIVIVCSGTEGNFTMEDVYTAGALICKSGRDDLTDAAFAAKFLYEYMRKSPELLYKSCAHLINLIDKGFSEDIEYSLKEDTMETIPYYKDGKIIRDI
ncbi:MAG: 2-phosphosulfolactate phosphatase [Thermoanaerobacteraceae bacterium]|nr:2-phosphosulfolactate phosphatase [Thermoanaerobacteraceae bacterium]